MKVFREFVQRVGALRPEIVIPLPAGKKKCTDCDEGSEEETDLFYLLGEDSGIRQLLTLVFDKAHSEFPEMFGEWVVEKKTQVRMYTYFLASIISDDFEWMSTSLEENVRDMQIQEKFFEDYINLFRFACKAKNIGKNLEELLLEKLTESR